MIWAGWLGAVLFSLCAVPQAWQSIKQGHSDGINNLFLLMWLGGEILTLIYVWPKQDWPLITNYLFNLTLIGIIAYYKALPRRT